MDSTEFDFAAQQPYSSTATTFNPYAPPSTTEHVEHVGPTPAPDIPVPDVLKFHLGELGYVHPAIVNYDPNHPQLNSSSHKLTPDVISYKELGVQKGVGYEVHYTGVNFDYNSTILARTGTAPSLPTKSRFIYEPTTYGVTNIEELKKEAIDGRIVKVTTKPDPSKPGLRQKTTYFLVIKLTPESQIRADIIGLYRTFILSNSDPNISKQLGTTASLPAERTFNESFSHMGNISASGGIIDPLVYEKSEGSKSVDPSRKGYPSLWIPLKYETFPDGNLKKSTKITTFDESIFFDRPSDWAALSTFDMKVIPSITMQFISGNMKEARIQFVLDSCIAYGFTKRQGTDSQADIKTRIVASGATDETLDLLRALRTAQSESEKSELNFVNVKGPKKEETAASTTTASVAVSTQQPFIPTMNPQQQQMLQQQMLQQQMLQQQMMQQQQMMPQQMMQQYIPQVVTPGQNPFVPSA